MLATAMLSYASHSSLCYTFLQAEKMAFRVNLTPSLKRWAHQKEFKNPTLCCVYVGSDLGAQKKSQVGDGAISSFWRIQNFFHSFFFKTYANYCSLRHHWKWANAGSKPWYQFTLGSSSLQTSHSASPTPTHALWNLTHFRKTLNHLEKTP